MKNIKRIVAIFLAASALFAAATFVSNGTPVETMPSTEAVEHTITLFNPDLFTDEAGTTDEIIGYIVDNILTTNSDETTEPLIKGSEVMDFFSSIIQFVKKLVDNILHYIETTIHIENW